MVPYVAATRIANGIATVGGAAPAIAKMSTGPGRWHSRVACGAVAAPVACGCAG